MTCYAHHTADDDPPAPREFPVDVSVNGIKVTVTLLLKPGTAVTVAETKTPDSPTPSEPDPAR